MNCLTSALSSASITLAVSDPHWPGEKIGCIAKSVRLYTKSCYEPSVGFHANHVSRTYTLGMTNDWPSCSTSRWVPTLLTTSLVILSDRDLLPGLETVQIIRECELCQYLLFEPFCLILTNCAFESCWRNDHGKKSWTLRVILSLIEYKTKK